MRPDRTRVVAAALGVCVGISGLDHGFFEVLQGGAATPGLFIQAIGPDQRMWQYGTEDAFTVVPTYLASGILAIALGLAIIVWSIGFIDRPVGSRVLLGLGVLLFLVGGGVAMLALLLIAWAMARRVGRPPRWVSDIPPSLAGRLSRAWSVLLATGLALYAFALEVAIVGFVPVVSAPDQVLVVCWASLLAMLACFFAAFVGASMETARTAPSRVHEAAARVPAR